MKIYLLGIDVGTTGSKALLIDARGKRFRESFGSNKCEPERGDGALISAVEY